jgi:hypothetical protein
MVGSRAPRAPIVSYRSQAISRSCDFLGTYRLRTSLSASRWVTLTLLLWRWPGAPVHRTGGFAVTDPTATALRAGLARLVRAGLRGVWRAAAHQDGPFVWAANHHSWWDPFIAFGGTARSGHPACLLDAAGQPFPVRVRAPARGLRIGRAAHWTAPAQGGQGARDLPRGGSCARVGIPGPSGRLSRLVRPARGRAADGGGRSASCCGASRHPRPIIDDLVSPIPYGWPTLCGTICPVWIVSCRRPTRAPRFPLPSGGQRSPSWDERIDSLARRLPWHS